MSARILRWDNLECDLPVGGDDLRSHSFDTIVGTDVVFSTKLVEPLLRTIEMLSHSETVAYLCLQERCADAHAMFVSRAKHYFDVEDWSERLCDVSECDWGNALECKLIVLKMRKGIERRTGAESRKRNTCHETTPKESTAQKRKRKNNRKHKKTSKKA